MKKIFKAIFFPNAKLIVFYVILLSLSLYIMGIPILDLMELKTFYLRFISRGKVDPAPEIVLAVIDEKSLDSEGRWPWPRKTIAKLIKRHKLQNIVADPVIKSSSGFVFMDKKTIDAYIRYLLPLVDVFTPNKGEAEIFSRMKIKTAFGQYCRAISKRINVPFALTVKSRHGSFVAQSWEGWAAA